VQEPKSLMSVFLKAVRAQLTSWFPPRAKPLTEDEKKEIIAELKRREAEMAAGQGYTRAQMEEMIKPLFDDWREAIRKEREEGPTPRGDR